MPGLVFSNHRPRNIHEIYFWEFKGLNSAKTATMSQAQKLTICFNEIIVCYLRSRINLWVISLCKLRKCYVSIRKYWKKRASCSAWPLIKHFFWNFEEYWYNRLLWHYARQCALKVFTIYQVTSQIWRLCR